ncbi:hypothetical protein DL771_008153 [Monosporascus sp. 5C6A]|nr:hypothetical protein DL771_008153 [Monosporascus sp. 5C6A]
MASRLHNKENDVEFDAQDHEVDSDFTALWEKRSPRRSGGGGGGSGGDNDESDSSNSTSNSTDENGSVSVAAGSAGFVASFATALSLCLVMGLFGV